MKKNLIMSLTGLLLFGLTITPSMAFESEEAQFDYAKSKKNVGFARISNSPVKDAGIWEVVFVDGDGKDSGPWVIQSYNEAGKYSLLPRGRNIFSLSADGKPGGTDCPSTDSKRFVFSAGTNKGEEHTAYCGTMRPKTFPDLIKGYTRKTVHKLYGANKIVDCAVFYLKNSESNKAKALNESTNWFDRTASRCVPCSEKVGPGCPEFKTLACPTEAETITPKKIDGYPGGTIGFLKYVKGNDTEEKNHGPFLLLDRQGTLSVPATGYFKNEIIKYETGCFKNDNEPQKVFTSEGLCKNVPWFNFAPGNSHVPLNVHSGVLTYNKAVYTTPTQLDPTICNSVIYSKPETKLEVIQSVGTTKIDNSISATTAQVAGGTQVGKTEPGVPAGKAEPVESAGDTSGGKASINVLSLFYKESSYTFNKGQDVEIVATLKGNPSKCSVKPSLPGDLTLNPKTCKISGTASVVGPEKSYTFRVDDDKDKNNYGEYSMSIKILEEKAPTFELTSTKTSVVKNLKENLEDLILTATGETLSSCSRISGSLPNGIAFKECKFSGGLYTTGSYEFTIEGISKESGLKSTVNIKVEVIDPSYTKVPFKITASSNLVIKNKFENLQSLTLSSSGETLKSCSVTSGNLPSGIKLEGCEFKGTLLQLGIYQFEIEGVSRDNSKSKVLIKVVVNRSSGDDNGGGGGGKGAYEEEPSDRDAPTRIHN